MKIPGIVLALAGLALAIYGVMLFGDSGASAEVLGVEIGVEDTGARMQSFLFIGLGVVALLGGIAMSRKS